jgi:hypothetical protein
MKELLVDYKREGTDGNTGIPQRVNLNSPTSCWKNWESWVLKIKLPILFIFRTVSNL